MTGKLYDNSFEDAGRLIKLDEGGDDQLVRGLYAMSVPERLLTHAKTPLNSYFSSTPALKDPNDYLPPLFYDPKSEPKTYELSTLINGDTLRISTEKLSQVYGGLIGPALDLANVKAWVTYELESWYEDEYVVVNANEWKSTSIIESKFNNYGGTTSPTCQLATLGNLRSEVELFDIGDGVQAI